MSSNDPPAEKKDPESQARASVAPASTRPLPPSEKRAASMPPPPPRRSVKPSGPPPPPPRLPRGQRLAGIFSAPPPALTTTAAAPAAAVAGPAIAAAPGVPSAPAETPSEEPAGVHPAAPQHPVAESPVAESPAAEPQSAPAQPAFAQPAVESPVAEPPFPALPALPVAALQAEAAGLPAAVVSGPPALPLAPSSSRLSPLPSSLSLPPPPLGLSARLVSTIPPRWIELARQHPALWMVAAPVALASLLIVVLLALEPAAQPVSSTKPAASAAAAPAPAEAAPAATPTPATEPKPDVAALAALAGKAPDSLSVSELLLLNEGRAHEKREEAQALSLKLQQQPELAKDESVQAQLLRLAADPVTADTALGAMAQARSPLGPDMLYEVWTRRATLVATAELARLLLYSRDVRAQLSPALAAALELRSANSCEAVQAALPKALSDGDRRSLAPLAKLNSRRACGAKSSGDCNPCVRGPLKPVVAAVTAVKGRRAPSFPAP